MEYCILIKNLCFKCVDQKFQCRVLYKLNYILNAFNNKRSFIKLLFKKGHILGFEYIIWLFRREYISSRLLVLIEPRSTQKTRAKWDVLSFRLWIECNATSLPMFFLSLMLCKIAVQTHIPKKEHWRTV